MLRTLASRRIFFLSLISFACALPASAAFDLDTGNAPIEVVIPTVAPIIFMDVSPSGGDATLVLRVTTVITNSWLMPRRLITSLPKESTPGSAAGPQARV